MTAAEIKQKMRQEYEKWKNYSDKRMHWYEDKRLVLVERQSQQISLISSISAAILAIIVVFKDKGNCWVEIAFWSMLVNVVLGILLLVWLRIFDEKILKANRQEERNIFSRFIRTALKGFNQPTSENLEKYYGVGREAADDIENSPDKFVGERKILEFLWVVFIVTFLAGVLGLTGVWLNKI